MSRLRLRNRHLGRRPARSRLGHDEAVPAMCSRRSAVRRAGRRGRPRTASTATVGPPEPSAPRWAAWSIPNAAPDTTVRPARVSSAAMSPRPRPCRTSCSCASRPSPRTSLRRLGQRQPGPAPRRPSGAPTGRSGARPPSRSSKRGGHSASPGTTNRMPIRCAASSRMRRGSRAASRSAALAAQPGQVGVGAEPLVERRAHRVAPTRRGQPGVAGSNRALRATRARRSSLGGAGRHRAARCTLRVDGRSRPSGAASATLDLLGTGGASTQPAQVGDRPRQPVHPDGAAPGQPAVVELALDQRRPRRPSGHRSASCGPGHVGVEPPRGPRVALASCRSRARSTRARTTADGSGRGQGVVRSRTGAPG